MYLTNRKRHVIHIYKGKSVTKVYYDCPRSIDTELHVEIIISAFTVI